VFYKKAEYIYILASRGNIGFPRLVSFHGVSYLDKEEDDHGDDGKILMTG
jgi:hypothetical protein